MKARSRLLLILLLGCALTNTSAVAQDLQSRVDIEGALQAAIEAEAGGDINKSFALYKKAYEGANRILPSDDTVRIDATFRLAFTYVILGRVDEAEPLYRETLESETRVFGPLDPETLTTSNNLAFVYEAQGRYGEAEQLFQTTLENRIRVLGDNHEDALITKNNLGALYAEQERFAEAEPLLSEVLESRIGILGESNRDTLVSKNNLAYIYQFQGRYLESEKLYKEAMDAQIKMLGPDDPDTLQSQNNLVGLYLQQDRYGDAEKLAQNTLESRIRVLGPEHPATLRSQNNLGAVYVGEGRFGEAERLVQKTLEIRILVLGPEHPSTLKSRLNLAEVLAAKDPPDMAGAVAQVREALAAARARQMRELDTAQSAERRSELVDDPNILDFALTLAARGFPEIGAEAVLITKGVGGEFEAAIRHAAAADPSLGDLPARLQAADSILSRAEAGNNTAAMRMARATRDALERELTTRSATYRAATESRARGVESVAAALPEGAVFLDYAIYDPIDFRTRKREEPKIYVVLYRRGQAPVGFDLGPFAAIAADMERLSRFDRLELLADCGTSKEGGCPDAAERVDLARIVPEGHSPRDVLEAASERLATTLLWPLGKMPPGSELVIAPDGALHRLNFALLIQDGEYLFESTRLRIVPNGRVVARAATHQQLSRRVFALGGAEYGPVAAHKICNRGDLRAGGFCPLPHAVDEVKAVAELAHKVGLEVSGPYSGPAATEAAAKQGLPGARIVHLATHGSIARPGLGSPMNRVALLFAGANDALLRKSMQIGEDGILYGYEASRIPLLGTELVVLSACQTALGEDAGSDGYYSMARAFRLAGAQNVLMSLWEVDDAKTAEFMAMFYHNWLEQDLTPAEALRTAQTDAKAAGMDPRHWAAFVLMEN